MLGFVKANQQVPATTGAQRPSTLYASRGFTEADQEAVATAARSFADGHARGTGLGFGGRLPEGDASSARGHATGRDGSDTISHKHSSSRWSDAAPADSKASSNTSVKQVSALERLKQRTRDALQAASTVAAEQPSSKPPVSLADSNSSQALIRAALEAKRRAKVIAAISNPDADSLEEAGILSVNHSIDNNSSLRASEEQGFRRFVSADDASSDNDRIRTEEGHVSAMFSAPQRDPNEAEQDKIHRQAKQQQGASDAAAAGIKRPRAGYSSEYPSNKITKQETDSRFVDEEDNDGDEDAALSNERVTVSTSSRRHRSLLDYNDQEDAGGRPGTTQRDPAQSSASSSSSSLYDEPAEGTIDGLNETEQQPLYKLLKAGHRVSVRWQADGLWYPAVVTSVTHAGFSNAEYGVAFDGFGSGDANSIEYGIGIQQIRRLPAVDYSRAPQPLPSSLTGGGPGGNRYAPGSFLARLHAKMGSSGNDTNSASSTTVSAASSDGAFLGSISTESAGEQAANMLLDPAFISQLASASIASSSSGKQHLPQQQSATFTLTSLLRQLAACLPDERFSGGSGSQKPLCSALALSLHPHLTPSPSNVATLLSQGSALPDYSGSSAQQQQQTRLRATDLCPRGDYCKQKHVEAAALLSLYYEAVSASVRLRRERLRAAAEARKAAAVAAVASLKAEDLAAPGVLPPTTQPALDAPHSKPLVAPPEPPVGISSETTSATPSLSGLRVAGSSSSLTESIVKSALLRPVAATPTGASAVSSGGLGGTTAGRWREKLAAARAAAATSAGQR